MPITLAKPNEATTSLVPPEILLTRSDVARILGVSPTTVTRWAREGRLPCRVTLGGHHRYSSRLIEEIRAQMAHGDWTAAKHK
jgi:excisionase family DNA binding protein